MDSLGVELQKKTIKNVFYVKSEHQKILEFLQCAFVPRPLFLQMQCFRQSFVDKYETEKSIECCTSIQNVSRVKETLGWCLQHLVPFHKICYQSKNQVEKKNKDFFPGAKNGNRAA